MPNLHHQSSFFSESASDAPKLTPRNAPHIDLSATELSHVTPSQLRFVGMTHEERLAIETAEMEDDDSFTPLEIADGLKAAAQRSTPRNIAMRQSLSTGTSLPRSSIMRRSILGGQRTSVFHSFDPMQSATSSKALLKELLLIHGPDVRLMDETDALRDVSRLYTQFQLERAIEATLLNAVKQAVAAAIIEAGNMSPMKKASDSEHSLAPLREED